MLFWSQLGHSHPHHKYHHHTHVQKAHDLRSSILIALVSYFSASKGECKNCVFEPFSPQVRLKFISWNSEWQGLGWGGGCQGGWYREQFCPAIFADGVIPTLFALLGDTHSVSKLFGCCSSSWNQLLEIEMDSLKMVLAPVLATFYMKIVARTGTCHFKKTINYQLVLATIEACLESLERWQEPVLANRNWNTY